MAQQNVYFAHHKEAAVHHEYAAKHHREANSLHEAGKHDAASHHALTAHGHTLHALHHSEEAARQHANSHAPIAKG